MLWDERWLILQIAAIALVFSVASSLVLERTVAGPMRRLSEVGQSTSAQNISARQDLPDLMERHDEVGQMGRAFVAMTNALYRRIEASEKFAADVAHELKNPARCGQVDGGSAHLRAARTPTGTSWFRKSNPNSDG